MPLQRSLRHEYALYIEREIESYKESVSRPVLLGIGDEAVAALAEQQQLALTELLVWEEVDRIIMRRLRLPNLKAWSRRRLRRLEKYRRPEQWGFSADSALLRTLIDADGPAHVLLSGARCEGSALHLAAHGVEVTAVEAEEGNVERMIAAAYDAGIAARVHGYVSDLASFSPELPLTAVVCSPTAFAGLTPEERERAIAVLQSATRDGGVHLVETIVAGRAALDVEELRARYRGWQISLEKGPGNTPTFMARKRIA